MTRKMPGAADRKGRNGKFDVKKFLAGDAAAKEAIASGETKIRKVVIEEGKDGLVSVRIAREHRVHGKSEANPDAGLPADLMLALAELLSSSIAGGKFSVVRDEERGDLGKDTLEMDLKPAPAAAA